MNKKMLQKIRYKKVRLFPSPYKRTLNRLSIINELWFVEDISNDYIELSYDSPNGWSKKIGLDHIIEFMTDSQYGSQGILILKSQLIIDGKYVCIEPLMRFKPKHVKRKYNLN